MGRNDDVDGSKTGTVLKGIVTTRATNPLVPDYQMPGRSVDGKGSEVNNPYGRTTAVTKSVKWEKGTSSLAESGLAQTQHTKSTAQKLDKFIN